MRRGKSMPVLPRPRKREKEVKFAAAARSKSPTSDEAWSRTRGAELKHAKSFASLKKKAQAERDAAEAALARSRRREKSERRKRIESRPATEAAIQSGLEKGTVELDAGPPREEGGVMAEGNALRILGTRLRGRRLKVLRLCGQPLREEGVVGSLRRGLSTLKQLQQFALIDSGIRPILLPPLVQLAQRAGTLSFRIAERGIESTESVHAWRKVGLGMRGATSVALGADTPITRSGACVIDDTCAATCLHALNIALDHEEEVGGAGGGEDGGVRREMSSTILLNPLQVLEIGRWVRVGKKCGEELCGLVCESECGLVRLQGVEGDVDECVEGFVNKVEEWKRDGGDARVSRVGNVVRMVIARCRLTPDGAGILARLLGEKVETKEDDEERERKKRKQGIWGAELEEGKGGKKKVVLVKGIAAILGRPPSPPRVLRDEVAEQLRKAAEVKFLMRGLKHLDLSQTGIGASGAASIASALQGHPGLETVSMIDSVEHLWADPCTHLARLVRSCKCLRRLDLSGNMASDAERDLAALADLICACATDHRPKHFAATPVTLSLRGCALLPRHLDRASMILKDDQERLEERGLECAPSRLSSIELGGNVRLTDACIANFYLTIAHPSHLEAISVRDTGAGPSTIAAVSSLLYTKHTPIRAIDLRGCHSVTEPAISPLLAVLATPGGRSIRVIRSSRWDMPPQRIAELFASTAAQRAYFFTLELASLGAIAHRCRGAGQGPWPHPNHFLLLESIPDSLDISTSPLPATIFQRGAPQGDPHVIAAKRIAKAMAPAIRTFRKRARRRRRVLLWAASAKLL